MPLKIAETVAASSGRLVPRAKIVKPTTTSETPIDKANFSAYITAKFEPTTSSTKPVSSIMKFLSISELPETTSITLDLSFERITRKYNKIVINPRLSIKLNFKSLRANKNKRKLNKNGIRDSSENLFLI